MEEEHKFGNFQVLERMYKYIPEAKEGKAHLDHVIDLCGTLKEGGTGLQNLRECIQWTEEKFNFEPKLKKPFWKQMSMKFLDICFQKGFLSLGSKLNFSSVHCMHSLKF